jgi:hypothetical protein
VGIKQARSIANVITGSVLSPKAVPFRAVKANMAAPSTFFAASQGLVLVFGQGAVASSMSATPTKTSTRTAAFASNTTMGVIHLTTRRFVLGLSPDSSLVARSLRGKRGLAAFPAVSTASFVVDSIQRAGNATLSANGAVNAVATRSPTLNMGCGSSWVAKATPLRGVRAAIAATAYATSAALLNRAVVTDLAGSSLLSAQGQRQRLPTADFRGGGGLLLVYQPTRYASAASGLVGRADLRVSTRVNAGSMPPNQRRVRLASHSPAIRPVRLPPIRVS